MTANQLCPSCGTLLPPDAPQGECPRCLLRAGYESEPAAEPAFTATRTSPGHAHFMPPTVAELQQRIPQYEILELIGQGGMGAVYKAKQRGLERLVAIKILPFEVNQSTAFAERFAREARALALLSHPHIVTVHDFGQADGLCYFVMEYVSGVNLRQALQGGKMNPEQALAIVPQICEALQYAHDEGVVHRDIKPENILIDRKGRVKIADFGLAKLLGPQSPEHSLTGTQQVMGTLRYMAPEQMFGSKEVDHRADIFSLGVVFYELLTGELPIGRFAPPSKKSGVDARLDDVVLRALESEPAQRYQHASELKTGVEQVSQSAPLAQKLPEPTDQPARAGAPPGQSPALRGGVPPIVIVLSLLMFCVFVYTANYVSGQTGTIVALFVGLAAATGFAWWSYRQARQQGVEQSPDRLRRAVPFEPHRLDSGDQVPRLSQTALWGALLSPLFLLSLCMGAVSFVPVDDSRQGAPTPTWLTLLFLVPAAIVGILGLCAPVVTTLLGVIAIGQIRRSAGRIYGMALAVFDALLFPLLLLDAVLLGLGFVCFLVSLKAVFPPSSGYNDLWPMLPTVFLLLPLVVVLDVWLIRLTWQGVNSGLPNDLAMKNAPAKEPPPFRPQASQRVSSGLVVAVVVLALFAVPTVLAVGVAAAYFFSSESRASKQEMENFAREPAAVESSTDEHAPHDHAETIIIRPQGARSSETNEQGH